MRDNINFVHKEINPPNVPQARPIEDFWGYLTQLVYAKGWEAKSVKQLVARIKKKLKEIDSDYLQTLMKGTLRNLRKIADNGLLSQFEKLKLKD